MGRVCVNALPDESPALSKVARRAAELEVVNVDNQEKL
jgi:hypothetical protein